MARTVKLSDVIPSRFAHLTPPNEENIERIRVDLVEGSKMLLNEPHAFRNESGAWELLAGHDRTEAARRAGWTEVQVRDFSGLLNDDDAILAHFCRENLLRKEVSKATIAGAWLKRHPEWQDTRVAVASGCSIKYVGEVRGDLVAAGAIEVPQFREAEDGTKRRAYKPRQVRGNVPSGKAIPHPTEKVLSREEQTRALREAEYERRMAAAAKAPTPTSAVQDPQGEKSEETPGAMDGVPTDDRPPVESVGVPSGVGAPAGVVASSDLTPAVRGEDAVRSEDVGLLLSFAPRPLTVEELRGLSDDDADRLTMLGRWCQQTVSTRRKVQSQPKQEVAA